MYQSNYIPELAWNFRLTRKCLWMRRVTLKNTKNSSTIKEGVDHSKVQPYNVSVTLAPAESPKRACRSCNFKHICMDLMKAHPDPVPYISLIRLATLIVSTMSRQDLDMPYVNGKAQAASHTF
jgi:hypothetical protein